jgi:glycosyltransferase involved in cell wall biosynthesis
MVICHITINPIDYERRIQNQAGSASEAGYNVWIVAMGKPFEKNQEKKENYLLWRILTPYYRGGPLKFLHFNWKVVLFLFKKRPDIIHCHDLWVLPAAVLPAIFTKCKLIYDAHEYYPGLEIFTRNKIKKKIWILFEYLAITRVDILLTVSEPLAKLYREKYPRLKQTEVIRNLPKKEIPKKKFNIPNLNPRYKKIILYQGHFRPGRGLENLIDSLPQVPEAQLVLIGGGELEEKLRRRIEKCQLKDRVIFAGYIATDQLISATACADLGIALFEPTSINYAYALPNKFFEYIMAGIPVLASNIDTFQTYIDEYKVGLTVDPFNVGEIANTINLMISNVERLNEWRKNTKEVSKKLNWEMESKKMNRIYEDIQK